MTIPRAENPPAFPSGDFTQCEPGYGMTLRDWFAGQALPAIIAATSAGQHQVMREGDTSIVAGITRDAYEMADAMLAARSS